MKPIFTIHAGEYLVGSEIEKKLRGYNVWIPSKDSGIDLLVTNRNNTKTASLQVKFSKDFNATHVKEVFRPYIKGAGWWRLNRNKIKNSKADLWVFILYSFQHKGQDYIIIKPKDLLSLFSKTGRSEDTIHCYITVTNNKTVFETRGVNHKDMQLVCRNQYNNKIRNLKQYLNNWQPVTQKLK
ncbi:MAG: hypothetical protein AB7O73_12170 [Bacteroidia bacterium]